MELIRELGASFGVCIVGGTVRNRMKRINIYTYHTHAASLSQVNISSDAQQISGIFIKNIIPSSPAESCKKLKVSNLKDLFHSSMTALIEFALLIDW